MTILERGYPSISTCPSSDIKYLNSASEVRQEIPPSGEVVNATFSQLFNTPYTVSKGTLYSPVTFVHIARALDGSEDTCVWQYYIKRE